MHSKQYKAEFIDSATFILATNGLDATDPGFPQKLYEKERVSAKSEVAIVIAYHLNKPSKNKTRKIINKHDISGAATMSADICDLWGVWRDPIPRWYSHFNSACLGKRNCKEGTVWRLEGSEEDYSWILKK